MKLRVIADVRGKFEHHPMTVWFGGGGSNSLHFAIISGSNETAAMPLPDVD